MKISLLDSPRCSVGEGPVWDVEEQALYHIDILGKCIHRHHLASGRNDTWPVPDLIGSMALRAGGGALVALKNGVHTYDFTSGATVPVACPEGLDPRVQFNDGKTDRQGRFVVGSTDGQMKEALGEVYSVEADGNWPPEPVHLNLALAVPVTLVLIASSFTCQMGVFAAEKGNVKGDTAEAATAQTTAMKLDRKAVRDVKKYFELYGAAKSGPAAPKFEAGGKGKVKITWQEKTVEVAEVNMNVEGKVVTEADEAVEKLLNSLHETFPLERAQAKTAADILAAYGYEVKGAAGTAMPSTRSSRARRSTTVLGAGSIAVACVVTS